jgi:peptidoglycan-associated lipoprotein
MSFKRLSSSSASSVLLSAICAAALVGCGSSVKLDDKAPPVENRTATPVDTTTPAQSQVTSVDLTKGPADTAGADRIVYFDFDSYTVRDDARRVIDLNAKVLAANRAKRMAAEGHTDERGGREYNLALGQKRAEAVVRALVVSGAAENQLEAVSFGKERPAATGSDEAAYAKNRRVELANR